MANIDKLLKKKGWTGKEVGKALISSLLYDIKHMQTWGTEGYKPLFSQEDLNKMTATLTLDKDLKVYHVYREMFYAIKEAFNKSVSFPHGFFHGYYRYHSIANLCWETDDAQEIASRHPLIVTESQYKRMKAELKTEIGAEKFCYAYLLLEAAGYFAQNPAKAPKDIQAAIKATKAQQITNKRVMQRWKELNSYGYCSLPDGRRKDQMPLKEWTKACDDAYSKDYKYIVNGVAQDEDTTRKHFIQENIYKAQELLWHGLEGMKKDYSKWRNGEEMPELTPEELEVLPQVLENLARHKEPEDYRPLIDENSPYSRVQKFLEKCFLTPLFAEIEWHVYEEEPEVTKEEILAEDITEYYMPYDVEDAPEYREEAKQEFKELKADYPKVFDAVGKYLQKAIPAFKGIKPTQYFSKTVTHKELAELDFQDYRKTLEPKTPISTLLYAFPGMPYTSRQQARAGIAIIQNPSKYELDEKGDYKVESPLRVYTHLDGLTEENKKLLQDLRNLMTTTLQYIYAHNAILDILGRVYDIEDMEVAKRDTTEIEYRIESLNRLLYMFYAHVFGDAQEKERKRAIIKEYFQPIDAAELRPSEEAIKEIEETVESIGYGPKARPMLANLNRLARKLGGI